MNLIKLIFRKELHKKDEQIGNLVDYVEQLENLLLDSINGKTITEEKKQDIRKRIWDNKARRRRIEIPRNTNCKCFVWVTSEDEKVKQ
jgi:hypothetical protein